ncbi:unnamed protein product [Ambrosiozyma monospora]|uniref:Unnamed protein product n=1 Tax=Ambrosiozyma monospora TaxID=43982 RepID=A0A9W6WEP9_AMBMO|nr:unnamed protein product [Ambrosiozyma monospora]
MWQCSQSDSTTVAGKLQKNIFEQLFRRLRLTLEIIHSVKTFTNIYQKRLSSNSKYQILKRSLSFFQTMNETYHISPIHAKFPVEFTFKADRIEFTKTFDNITLSTTANELFQLSKEDGYINYTLLIENEYYYIPSSSDSDANSPLYEILSLGTNVSPDRVPTILAVTVFCSELEDEESERNRYFKDSKQPLQGTSRDLAHDTTIDTNSQTNENQRAFAKINENGNENEEVMGESRRSGRFLSKVVLSDGSSKPITGHSYDRLEDSHLYVDQLATCSVKYVVEGTDKNGVQRKIELGSQQCIIVDTDPAYEPYVMLSNSARDKNISNRMGMDK